jgi:hypothetical protein
MNRRWWLTRLLAVSLTLGIWSASMTVFASDSDSASASTDGGAPEQKQTKASKSKKGAHSDAAEGADGGSCAQVKCPAAGTLNCMPRVDSPMPDACKKKNRPRVQACCPDVQITD